MHIIILYTYLLLLNFFLQANIAIPNESTKQLNSTMLSVVTKGNKSVSSEDNAIRKYVYSTLKIERTTYIRSTHIMYIYTYTLQLTLWNI